MFITAGVLLLISAAFTSAAGQYSVGNVIAIAAYFLLLFGVVLAIVHYQRENRE